MQERPGEKLFGRFNWQWIVVSFGYMIIFIVPLAMMLPQILSISPVSRLSILVVGVPGLIGFYTCYKAREFILTESSLGSIIAAVVLFVLFHSFEPSYFPSLMFVPLSSALGSVLGRLWKLRGSKKRSFPATE